MTISACFRPRTPYSGELLQGTALGESICGGTYHAQRMEATWRHKLLTLLPDRLTL
jgi:hypothetical protein